MGKPHKFAWNGIDVETTLSIEQLANMAQRAAQECTGDLLHGKQRIASTKSTDRQIEFRINDFLITFKKYLVFHLDFAERSGRTWMSSAIDWYITTQPTVGGFIPVASKVMVGHHVYMEFVYHLAKQVKAADPQSRITVREGVATASAKTVGPDQGPTDPTSAPAASIQLAAPVATPTPTPPLSAPPPIIARPAVQPPPPPMPPVVRPPAVASPIGSGATTLIPPMPGFQPAIPEAPQGRMPLATGMVTSVPGMPSRPSAAAPPPPEPLPSRYASIAEQLFAEDESLYNTQMVQLTPQARPWSVALPDGNEVRLEPAAVFGRNPSAPPGSAARAVSVDDPYRSVSKTHALLDVRDGLVWVTDLHSTNGTTLTNDVGEAIACDPGIAVPVGDGWVVGLGEFNLTIRRG
ncbi:MAG TPA: FHA domain-containing protein [Propionicimonas sp.]|nr:FHA domain-containing protein [Propionicimonas sp.]